MIKKIWMLCTNTKGFLFFFFSQLLLLKTERVWRSETFHMREKLPSCSFPHAVLTCFHQLHRVTSSTLKANHRLGVCSYQLQIGRFLPVRPQHSSSNFPPLWRVFCFVSSGWGFFLFLTICLAIKLFKSTHIKEVFWFSTNRPHYCTAEVTKIIYPVP